MWLRKRAVAREFQSTRPSRASTATVSAVNHYSIISIHKALAGLDQAAQSAQTNLDDISIHKALAGLDPNHHRAALSPFHFNPQGPRGPRLFKRQQERMMNRFQSTRPSRASTGIAVRILDVHKYFNPQGPRGPRRCSIKKFWIFFDISIHKALAGLDLSQDKLEKSEAAISIHKALAGLDTPDDVIHSCIYAISIHKALAGLDPEESEEV